MYVCMYVCMYIYIYIYMFFITRGGDPDHDVRVLVEQELAADQRQLVPRGARVRRQGGGAGPDPFRRRHLAPKHGPLRRPGGRLNLRPPARTFALGMWSKLQIGTIECSHITIS